MINDDPNLQRIDDLEEALAFAQSQIRDLDSRQSPEEKHYFADGNWYAVTLGHFIELLVDAGQDPAVAFRVVQDYKDDEKGAFVREIRMFLIPNGQVIRVAKGCHGIHKTLKALIQAGIVT